MDSLEKHETELRLDSMIWGESNCETYFEGRSAASPEIFLPSLQKIHYSMPRHLTKTTFGALYTNTEHRMKCNHIFPHTLIECKTRESTFSPSTGGVDEPVFGIRTPQTDFIHEMGEWITDMGITSNSLFVPVISRPSSTINMRLPLHSILPTPSEFVELIRLSVHSGFPVPLIIFTHGVGASIILPMSKLIRVLAHEYEKKGKAAFETRLEEAYVNLVRMLSDSTDTAAHRLVALSCDHNHGCTAVPLPKDEMPRDVDQLIEMLYRDIAGSGSGGIEMRYVFFDEMM